MKLINGDCREALHNLPAESVDLLVTDPPYRLVGGGGCGKHRLTGIFNRDLKEVRDGRMFTYNDITFAEWVPEVYRVLKDGSHAYIMINGRNLKELWQAAENAGFKFQNLLVWKKNNMTPGQYYLKQTEFILMLRKGHAKPILEMGTSNCLEFKNILGNKVHPTEKPVELMEVFIRNSSLPGDTVLDPFMGSGSTGKAAFKLGREFIGVEIDSKYYDTAQKRFAGEETE